MNTTQDFLRWEERSLDVIDVKRCYVKIAGDLATGVLLSQIVYWFLPSKRTGNPRVTIDREGRSWLAKKRDEWWDECCVSPKQFDRSVEILESLQIVTTAVFRFQGSPTKHISLNFGVLIELIERGENGSSLKVNNENTQRGSSKFTKQEEPLLTETTPETTQRLPEEPDTVDSRILCEELGVFRIKEQEEINRMYRAFCRKQKLDPVAGREYLKRRWGEYQAAMPKLEWAYASAYAFLMSGIWNLPDLWQKKKSAKEDPMAKLKFFNSGG